VLLCNVRIVQTMMTLCMLMLCSASAALVMNGVHSAKTLCCMLQLASICSWGGERLGWYKSHKGDSLYSCIQTLTY